VFSATSFRPAGRNYKAKAGYMDSAIHPPALAHPQAHDRRRLLLHESFRAGITLKGIDGLLEAIGGVILWSVKPGALNSIALKFLELDLPFDRHEFITTHLYNVTERLADGGKHFASLYLLAHGLIKALLVIALWFDALWAYPLTIFVFGVFCVYQVHRFMYTHSLALILITFFDVLIIWLTWREYRDQKLSRHK
jgi:uncharacterized membrane protein